MTIYQMTICGFAQMLRALKGQLDKADAHALAIGYDPRNLLSARLAPDMHPLSRYSSPAPRHAKRAADSVESRCRHFMHPTTWIRRVR